MAALNMPLAAVIEWGSAGRSLAAVSGDLPVVVPFPSGALVALVDGLGHGLEAAEAARAAAEVLTRHPEEPLPALVRRCHESLRRTRGVAMSVVVFRAASASSLTWLGVGNVDCVLLRAPGSAHKDHGIAVRGGVVGYLLPPLRETDLPVYPGDTLVMTTDGIRSGGIGDVRLSDAPQSIAQAVLDARAKPNDDAHVLVARFVGGL